LRHYDEQEISFRSAAGFGSPPYLLFFAETLRRRGSSNAETLFL
jgi:hypothetical protein